MTPHFPRFDRSRRGFALLLGGGLASPLWSCGAASVPVSLKPPGAPVPPSRYKSVLRSWTRSRRLNTIEEMDNVLTVTSTYYSPEFRSAYLSKYKSDFHLTQQEAKELSLRHDLLQKESHEFYVALFAQRQKYAFLDEEESAFVVRLVDDRGRVAQPTRLERIRRPGVVEKTYFPYTNSFRTVYRVIFDQGPVFDAQFSGSSWFGLRFSGPQGSAVLSWHLG